MIQAATAATGIGTTDIQKATAAISGG